MAPFVVRTVAGREQFVEYLRAHIPMLVVIADRTRNALDTFVDACRSVGDGAAVHMEDDVLLTSEFVNRIESSIRTRPAMPIQFFSMRSADMTVGSREEPGRTFLMGQCFYLPAGVSAELARYSQRWPRRNRHPTGLDMMVADYLAEQKQRYWIHVPSLVQHRKCKSAIDPRRASSRQSPTFENPDAH